MSKKKKNIMDGYFDQFKDEVADINPHVADMVKTNNSSMENHLIIGGELLDNRPMRALGDTNAAKTQPKCGPRVAHEPPGTPRNHPGHSFPNAGVPGTVGEGHTPRCGWQ